MFAFFAIRYLSFVDSILYLDKHSERKSFELDRNKSYQKQKSFQDFKLLISDRN